jgi:putative oxidoreductase
MTTHVPHLEAHRGMGPTRHYGSRALRFAVPLGRLLFSLIFVLSVGHLFSPGGASEAARHGVPLAPIAVPIAGLLALGGGVSVALGYHARVGAWLLVLFLVPVTLFMHAFWAETDPAAVQMQQVQFMKNIGLLGAALVLTYLGAGPVSVDETAE